MIDFFRFICIFQIITMLVILSASLYSKEMNNPKGPKLIISYTLHRISRMASNQIAVWIEDSSGKLVRTLYVTNFTAKGGYARRAESLDTWVKKADWENATKDQVDAISGATQSPGKKSITWDCRDSNGKIVPKGKYFYNIEGNIYWDNKVFVKGEILIGDKKINSKADLIYVPKDASQYGILIEDVSAEYYP